MAVIPFFVTLLLVQATTQHSLSPRISNGKDATRDQFPFVASVQFKLPLVRIYNHVCAGAVIGQSWILSTGECIDKISGIGSARVGIGLYYTDKKDDSVQYILVADKFPHENFDKKQKPNNIGLIELASGIQNPVLVRFPQQGVNPTGQVWIMGWGKISEAYFGGKPEVLQYAPVYILETSFCNMYLSGLNPPEELLDMEICTLSLGTPITGCIGDNGGPLIRYVNGEPEVIGLISSIVEPCGQDSVPTRHTDVSQFLDWITDNTRKTANKMSESDDLFTPLLAGSRS